MQPEERFAALADEFIDSPGVSLPGETGQSGFGSGALKVNGSIFAMLTSGRLVVKLPAGPSHRAHREWYRRTIAGPGWPWLVKPSNSRVPVRGWPPRLSTLGLGRPTSSRRRLRSPRCPLSCAPMTAPG